VNDVRCKLSPGVIHILSNPKENRLRIGKSTNDDFQDIMARVENARLVVEP